MSPSRRPTTSELTDDRFLADFRSMSAHGATAAGGVHREAGTAADTANRHWFHGLLEGYGATVAYDDIGNQFGLWELVPGQPYVLLGSHLDSQPYGGRFDGAYGVLCGAHACARLAAGVRSGELDAPRHNVAVVNWFNEEGSRFKPSMMGSSVFTGKSTAADMLAVTDADGVTVREQTKEFVHERCRTDPAFRQKTLHALQESGIDGWRPVHTGRGSFAITNEEE